MLFSSADYPIFLIAVFFVYGLLRTGRLPGALARVGLLLLLGDLIYLLLAKDVGALWDPLGALAFRAIVRDAPSLGSPLRYLAGATVFGGGVVIGLTRGARLGTARAQAMLAAASMTIIAGMGAAIFVTHRQGTLGSMTALFVAHGHLIFLGIYGVAIGAGLRDGESRHVGRLIALFLVSAIFYHSWAASMPRAYKYLLLLILFTIVLDYYLAIWIDGADTPWIRRALVIASLVSNLGILAVFKYWDFFVRALHLPMAPLALILPAGISFHTFQSLSYTIDVYRRKLPATRSVLQFATFVLFFPQLVAGPIVRAQDFLPQLGTLPPYDAAKARAGLFRILVGLFKKIALADFLGAMMVDRVFKTPDRFSGVEVLFGVYAYAFQIYLDFSAYSDIAIGSAQVLGFDFPENFRTPYRSANLQEFWRRWHITLSTWLREYVYITFGGSRGEAWKTYRNLLLTMVLGGLWHGANWTFVVWGLLHGGGLAMTRAFQRRAEGGVGQARRALVWMWGVGVVGAALHVLLVGEIRAAAAAVGVDPTWLHLVFAWAYATPAWAAITAYLTLEEAPPAVRAVAGESTRSAGAQSAGESTRSARSAALRAAALPARLACCALTLGALAAIWKGPHWLWLPVIVAWFGTAVLGDVFEAAPDVAAAMAYGRWAVKRAAAMLLTFHYVCFGWIFFRAESFARARDVLAQIGGFARDHLNLLPTMLLALSIAVLAHLFPPGTYRWVRERFVALPAPAQAVVMVACALVLRKLANPIVVPFIYFQF